MEHHSSTTKALRAQVFGIRAGLAFVWNPYILIVAYAFNFAEELGAWSFISNVILNIGEIKNNII